MSVKATQAEHQHRIACVLDYIFTHIGQDPGLQTLAGVAHYSPFHLQKLFKQQIGETPKQYGLHLKLETAFHWLIIQPQRSVREIALDTGFSSPAVFSRDMKNYFGHSPEQLRRLSHRQQMKLLHGGRDNIGGLQGSVRETGQDNSFPSPAAGPYTVEVVHQKTVRGIYQLAPFTDPGAIREAFSKLGRSARSLGMENRAITYLGVLTPHQRNTYRALLPIWDGFDNTGGHPVYEIKGGVFARFVVCGDRRETNKAAHYFYRRWLPESGYRIAGIAGFETFEDDPAGHGYTQVRRRIHVPIQPDI